MDAFLLALQFLTRIPVSCRDAAGAPLLGRSVLYYPAVGLLLGVLLSLPPILFAGSAPMLLAAIVLTGWVLLTGGLHLDGLADCADAWVGGYGDKQRSLQIMKDPASGPIAVSLLVLVLVLKFAALTAMFEQTRLAPLLLAPVLGRTAILGLMLTTDYIRPKGLAEALLQQLPRAHIQAVLVISVLTAAVFLGLPAVLFAGGVLFWVRQTAVSRLGGVTGDVYGAAVELTEAAVLMVAMLQ
ncbi:adenosylcobinamide-GDP ribazoletransferase [Methylomonas defluvii]|uniref:Adenosylcobinamide-GDP ribazoletransferase n=1 Tax=Methylomonas defluvii TaxID=3045149 RepID=A0ABU4UC15_9GAMM|nr:adenosylcobinamide-GDP ribazoletransferase [Methylomonas sp. OY6]MDX8126981.1 adenosylcobinamide-GDP ribazoletransferase [Methylomonas sp. OY6]NOV31733.1 adenosylcobinamide-GDP ribazoletransferase [Methylomonas sp. ZR1]